LLDHSGNITRFAEDYTDIFFNGLNALDMGEKLDKKIRKDDEEKDAKGCPSCGFKPFAKRCMSCGFEIQPLALHEHQPGEMREIVLGGKKLADDRRHLWQQVATYAKAHSRPEKQQGRAAHLFKAMTGGWPPRDWTIDTPNVEITRAVRNQIQAANIRFAKRQPVAA
jgi:hypothetical protein